MFNYMADLKVDPTLDTTNDNLKAIHAEFSDAGKNVKADADIWGQSDLAHAMKDFVDNWYIHREKMDKKLKGLSDNVDDTVSTWDKTETDIANGVKTEQAS